MKYLIIRIVNYALINYINYINYIIIYIYIYSFVLYLNIAGTVTNYIVYLF